MMEANLKSMGNNLKTREKKKAVPVDYIYFSYDQCLQSPRELYSDTEK